MIDRNTQNQWDEVRASILCQNDKIFQYKLTCGREISVTLRGGHLEDAHIVVFSRKTGANFCPDFINLPKELQNDLRRKIAL